MTKRNKDKFTGTTLTLGAFYARTEAAPSDPGNSQAITNIPSNEASPSDPNNSQATTNIPRNDASLSDPINSQATTNISSTEASTSNPSNSTAMTNIPQLLQAHGEECSTEAVTKKTEAGLEKNAELSTETHSMDYHGQNQKAQQSTSFTLPLYSDECAGKNAMPGSLIPSTEASPPNTSSSKAITDTNIPSTEANITSSEAIARPSQSPSPRDHCTSSGGAHLEARMTQHEETMTKPNKEKLTGIALSLGASHASTEASQFDPSNSQATTNIPSTDASLSDPSNSQATTNIPSTDASPFDPKNSKVTTNIPSTETSPSDPPNSHTITNIPSTEASPSDPSSQTVTNIPSIEASPINPSKSQAITITTSESKPQCCCLRCSTEADELNSDDKIPVSDYILACHNQRLNAPQLPQNQGPKPRLPLAQAEARTKKTEEPLTSNELYAGEYTIPESFTSFLRSENSVLCPWAWDGGASTSASTSASATPRSEKPYVFEPGSFFEHQWDAGSFLEYQRDAKARWKREDGDKSG